MVCLDTNFLILLIRQDSETRSKLRRLTEPLYTTIISLVELYKGVYDKPNVDKEIRKIETILRFIRVIALDHRSCKIFGELYAKLKPNPLEDADLLIASMVISNNETLLTRNVRHFGRVSDLKTETW
jgi:tRNA(fMet)-specific endonuclease VapC